MNLGPQLKRIRTARSLTLKQVASGTDLTPSLISQIENARALPSLPSLTRLLAFYRVSLVEFFGQVERESCLVCRAADVETVEVAPGLRMSLFASKLARTTLVTLKIELDPGVEFAFARLSPELNGERFALVEAGSVEVRVDEETLALAPGDSVNFKADVDAAVRNAGRKAARLLLAGLPPLFFNPENRSGLAPAMG